MLNGSVPAPRALQPTKIDPSDSFFTNGAIPHLRIELDKTALAALRQDSRRYVRATVKEGETAYSDVGLHLKGGLASFQSLDEKPCLTLNFDKFVRGQKFHGLDKFHLNNSVQDPTFMCELIGGELSRAAGIPAPLVTHARVELNGRDLGFYVLVEGFDKSFLRRHFSNPNGNLYDGGEKTDIFDPLRKTSGDGPDDRSDLKALVAAAQATSNRLDQLETVLDLDRFYSFLALEALTCHWDGYARGRNNYRLYRDPASDRFVFLPHGMDQLFSQPQSSLLPDCAGYLAWSVLDLPAGRQRHREQCLNLFTNLLAVEALTNRVTALQRRLRPALSEISPKLAQSYDAAVERLRQQIAVRVAFLEKELKGPPLQPLAFDANQEAHLAAWIPHIDGGAASLAEVEEPKPSLQIQNVAVHVPFIASWRTRVLLPTGRYRFQGTIRATGFMPMENAPCGGICLRVFAYALPRSQSMAGDTDWRTYQAEFYVTAPKDEAELICEVRAFKGTVWIDKTSLKLVRLSDSP